MCYHHGSHLQSLKNNLISGIPVGQVTVNVTLTGYNSQTKTATIWRGKNTVLNFNLELEKPAPTLPPAVNQSIPVNLLTQYGWRKSTVISWKNGTAYVHDATGGNDTVDGASIDRNARKVTSYGSGTWGVTTVWWSNHEITRAKIAVLPCVIPAFTTAGRIISVPNPRLTSTNQVAP